MLKPKKDGVLHKGLQSLLNAQRADLSLEFLVLRPEFRSLFTPEELQEAKNRLDALPENSMPLHVPSEENFAEEVYESKAYSEGAVKTISVNSYERNPEARKACIKKWGTRCAVCNMSFTEHYGVRGKGFIHVHHRWGLSTTKGAKRTDPVKDLVPVCPNCHAMLHTQQPPLSVEELRAEMGK